MQKFTSHTVVDLDTERGEEARPSSGPPNSLPVTPFLHFCLLKFLKCPQTAMIVGDQGIKVKQVFGRHFICNLNNHLMEELKIKNNSVNSYKVLSCPLRAAFALDAPGFRGVTFSLQNSGLTRASSVGMG